MRRRVGLCILLLALVLFACGGDDNGAAEAEPETPRETQPDSPAAPDQEFFLPDGTVVVRAGDPTFRAPGNLPPGPTSFTVRNEGSFAHQMRLVEIDEEDAPLYEIAKRAPKAILEEVDQLGIIRRVKPRELSTERIDVELAPGRYGLLCLIVLPSGNTHAAFGMSTEFTVTE